LTAGVGFEHFVGRGPELARLLAAFRKTKAEGIGSALVLACCASLKTECSGSAA
jgi:hypothetical protein